MLRMRVGLKTSEINDFLVNSAMYAIFSAGFVALKAKKVWDGYKVTPPEKPKVAPEVASNVLPVEISTGSPPKDFRLPEFPVLKMAFKGLDDYPQLASALQLVANEEFTVPSRRGLFQNAAYLTPKAGHLYRDTSLAHVTEVPTFPLDLKQLEALKTLFNPVNTAPELVKLLSQVEASFNQHGKDRWNARMAGRLSHTVSILKKGLQVKI